MRNSNVGSRRGDVVNATTITMIRLDENRARLSILSGPQCPTLLHVEEFNVEQQRSVGRNRRRTTLRAVGQVRRDHKPPLTAYAHADEALVPALDNASRSESKDEGLTSNRRVELTSLVVGLARRVQPPRIVHRQRPAHYSFGTRSNAQIRLREWRARR